MAKKNQDSEAQGTNSDETVAELPAQVLATPVAEAVPAAPPNIVVAKFRAAADTDQYHAQQLERHLSHFGWVVLLNPEADGEVTLFIGPKPQSAPVAA